MSSLLLGGELPGLSGSSPSFPGWPLPITQPHLPPRPHGPSPVQSSPVYSLELSECTHSSGTCVLTHTAPSVCNAFPSLCPNSSSPSFQTHLGGHLPQQPCPTLRPGEMTCFPHMSPRSLTYHTAYHSVLCSLVYWVWNSRPGMYKLSMSIESFIQAHYLN